VYRLIVEMEDDTSLSADSAIESLKPVFGHNSVIKAFPLNNSPQAHLEFAISEMMVHDLVEAYFDLWPHLYDAKANQIKDELLRVITETINNVEKEILTKLE